MPLFGKILNNNISVSIFSIDNVEIIGRASYVKDFSEKISKFFWDKTLFLD